MSYPGVSPFIRNFNQYHFGNFFHDRRIPQPPQACLYIPFTPPQVTDPQVWSFAFPKTQIFPITPVQKNISLE